MKAIWKGSISFGLVNIPVSLMAAEEPNELSFSLMDANDHAKIKYQRINANTGEEVAWADIVKYYEFPDGSYVIVTDEDFEKADPKAAKAVEIEAFINADDLSPMFLEKPYYLVPNKGGEKAYVLLRDAMLKTGQIAIGRLSIRTKQSLCAIIPCDEGLALILLRFASELRGMEDLKLPKNVKTSEKELELAVELINQLAVAWEPGKYKDKYSEALMARLRAKKEAAGKALADEEAIEEPQPSKVIDLMALLQQSVESKQKSDQAQAQ